MSRYFAKTKLEIPKTQILCALSKMLQLNKLLQKRNSLEIAYVYNFKSNTTQKTLKLPNKASLEEML